MLILWGFYQYDVSAFLQEILQIMTFHSKYCCITWWSMYDRNDPRASCPPSHCNHYCRVLLKYTDRQHYEMRSKALFRGKNRKQFGSLLCECRCNSLREQKQAFHGCCIQITNKMDNFFNRWWQSRMRGIASKSYIVHPLTKHRIASCGTYFRNLTLLVARRLTVGVVKILSWCLHFAFSRFIWQVPKRETIARAIFSFASGARQLALRFHRSNINYAWLYPSGKRIE